ncbi:hypothetical protein KAU33_09300 [Candidatus Dependentiae bacterium]|nr:hypothetical protein [Candidatus Dependentiae bacterium]
MGKVKYEMTQPPHMTDEEFESFASDIDSIIRDNLCIDCDDNGDCKKGVACKYYAFDKVN